MMWKIRIEGDAHDLNELQQSFSDGSVVIEHGKHDQYYLIADTFQECVNDEEVRKLASSLIDIVSGASRLALGGNLPITQSETVKVNEDGTKSIFTYFHENILFRDSLHTSVIYDDKGNVVEGIKPADDVPTWVSMGMKDEAIAKVLRLFNRPLKWVELYKIYEIIESDAGGLDTLVSNGWAKKTDIKLFKHTSNSPGAIGDEARHGKEFS